MTAYVYIVRCSDNTLYTGWTYDIDKRISAHNSGLGAKYTRSRKPVSLFYSEEFDTKEEALSREVEIKKLKRADKEKLLKQ